MGGAERANYQLFLTELCELLEVPRPEPTVQDESANAYVFEKAVAFDNGDGTKSHGWIDLYRRGAFVCETKQGVQQEQQCQGETPLSQRQQSARKQRKTGHGRRGIRRSSQPGCGSKVLTTTDVGSAALFRRSGWAPGRRPGKAADARRMFPGFHP